MFLCLCCSRRFPAYRTSLLVKAVCLVLFLSARSLHSELHINLLNFLAARTGSFSILQLDSRLQDTNWKFHIDNVALKIGTIVGVIARLRHFVPLSTLISIYHPLILPYSSYGLSARGQATKVHLNTILFLQKRALRLMYFCEPRFLTQSHSSSLPKLFL